MAIHSAIFDPLREALADERYRIKQHAAQALREDRLFLAEAIETTQTGRVIEDYPGDLPYPSCLVYGRTSAGDPVHSVWSYSAVDRAAILVTCYRPDPGKWIHFEVRR